MRVAGTTPKLNIERSYITRVVHQDFQTEVVLIDYQMFLQKGFQQWLLWKQCCNYEHVAGHTK